MRESGKGRGCREWERRRHGEETAPKVTCLLNQSTVRAGENQSKLSKLLLKIAVEACWKHCFPYREFLKYRGLLGSFILQHHNFFKKPESSLLINPTDKNVLEKQKTCGKTVKTRVCLPCHFQCIATGKMCVSDDCGNETNNRKRDTLQRKNGEKAERNREEKEGMNEEKVLKHEMMII